MSRFQPWYLPFLVHYCISFFNISLLVSGNYFYFPKCSSIIRLIFFCNWVLVFCICKNAMFYYLFCFFKLLSSLMFMHSVICWSDSAFGHRTKASIDTLQTHRASSSVRNFLVPSFLYKRKIRHPCAFFFLFDGPRDCTQ